MRSVYHINIYQVLLVTMFLAGCQAVQVENKTLNMSSTLPDFQYRQVMDNLAAIADNPANLPYFNVPAGGKTTIQRTGQANVGLAFNLVSAATYAPGTILSRFFGRTVLNSTTPTIQGVQQNIEEWDTSPFLDPIKQTVMQGLYRKALGVQNSPYQLRMTQKFFYDYPNANFNDSSMLQPDGLWSVNMAAADLAKRQAALTNRWQNPPPELRESFAQSQQVLIGALRSLILPDANQSLARDQAAALAEAVLPLLRSDPKVNDNKAIATALNKTAAATNALSSLLQDELPSASSGDKPENYHAEFRELYHSIQPGWLCVGTSHDVPKDSLYIGKHGSTYVWTNGNKMEQLTNLTIAIVDVATANTSESGKNSTTTTTPGQATGSSPKNVVERSLDYIRPSGSPVIIQQFSTPEPAARSRMNTFPSSGPNVVPSPP